MLDKLITFTLHQRVFVLAGVLVLLIFGVRALQDLPIEAFPDVQDVQVERMEKRLVELEKLVKSLQQTVTGLRQAVAEPLDADANMSS